MRNKLRVYYLGSGDIAIAVLQALLNSDKISLAGIGTQVDRAAGRKKALTPTMLGQYCRENDIAVEKIPSVNDQNFFDSLKSKAPDMLVVLSFGQILKPPVLELPPLGCVNIHASLLPRYRGASPIAAAILNADRSTGVSFMQMDAGLDTGAVYSTYSIDLDGNEYADALEQQLATLAAGHVEQELLNIAAGGKAQAQDEKNATITCKISKKQGKINWSLDARHIERMTRAFYPWPGACFTLGSGEKLKTLRVTAARVHDKISGTPGEIIQADKNALVIACGSGALEIIRLVPGGKAEMTARAFLNGYRIEEPTAG